MGAFQAAGAADELDAAELPAWELDGWRDPAGNDVGERLRPVRLTWSAWWGDHRDFYGEVCCPDRQRARHRETGPVEVATTAYRASYRNMRDKIGHDGLRHPRSGGRPYESVLIYLTVQYHYQPDRDRKRKDKTYHVEEKPQWRPWTFETGDPGCLHSGMASVG